MIDLRQLRYFVAVAEEEHVGRAAERLHISQSPLSRQIAQLEESLGLNLFERTQQRLRLTVDGRTFLAETKALLTHAKRLESLGKRLGRGEEGGLCIGYIENAMHTSVLPDALSILRAARHDLHIALYSQSSVEQLEGLRQRSLDIALVSEPPPKDDPDLDCALVLNDVMLLALPIHHPLAHQSLLSAEDLQAAQWISVAPATLTHRTEALTDKSFVAACLRAGFTPNIHLQVTEPMTALRLVGAGLGIAMLQRNLGASAPAGVILREVPWMQYATPVWAAWHRINLRPLVAMAKEVLLSGESLALSALADQSPAALAG